MRSFGIVVSFCGCLCAAGLPQPSQALPSPEDLKKYVCEVATQRMIEDVAIGKICHLINSTFPDVKFSPDCMSVLEQGWDLVTKYCPKGVLSMPSPRDVEKYVCDVVTQKLVEEMATDKVCKLIEKRFPKVHFGHDCHTAVEMVWDKVVSHCPKGRLSMPSPRDVEKYVCDVATQKLIEDMATDKVCELIQERFPTVHFSPNCHTAVELVWDKVASLCPKGSVSMPSPNTVVKYVCEVATQKLIEDTATDKVCELIKDHFPNVHFKPDCHTAVENVWDKVTSFCPKGSLFMPSPRDLEKYVCDVATKKLIEEMATHKICGLISKKFPKVHFGIDCHTAVEKAWNRVVSMCPKGTDVIVV